MKQCILWNWISYKKSNNLSLFSCVYYRNWILYTYVVTVQFKDIKIFLSVPVSFPVTPSRVLRDIRGPLLSICNLDNFFFWGVSVIIAIFSSGAGSAHLSWLLLSSGVSLAARDQWLWTLPLLHVLVNSLSFTKWGFPSTHRFILSIQPSLCLFLSPPSRVTSSIYWSITTTTTSEPQSLLT